MQTDSIQQAIIDKLQESYYLVEAQDFGIWVCNEHGFIIMMDKTRLIITPGNSTLVGVITDLRKMHNLLQGESTEIAYSDPDLFKKIHHRVANPPKLDWAV